MSRLANIDELIKKYDYVASFDNYGEIENSELLDEIPTVDAIIVPKNATVGDMIKAMFPDAYTGLSVRDNEVYIMNNGKRICRFSLDLWNSPYRKEGEKINRLTEAEKLESNTEESEIDRE